MHLIDDNLNKSLSSILPTTFLITLCNAEYVSLFVSIFH